jgi:iron complex outermembrane receptor protein
MNIKYYFIQLLVFAFWQTDAWAQRTGDTLAIDEVLIRASRENFYGRSNSNYLIDSTITKYYTQNSIAELLQYFTPVYINQYGTGGAASLSVRGTADDQTNIFWNGVKLNSLSLGTIDVSLTPINAAQNIEVVTNSASSAFGSGNFGAAIILNTQPVFQKQTNVFLRQTFGSFKNYITDVNFTQSNSKIYFSSSTTYRQSKNNFPFYDRYKINTPLVTQSNNKLRQWTTINELHIKLKKQQNLSFGNFTLGKYYQIPTIMGSFEQSAKFQKDFGTKTFVHYSKIFKNGKLAVRNTYAYDYMQYNDSIVNILSEYKIHQLLQGLNYLHQFGKHFSLDAGTDYNINFANVEAYVEKQIQHRFALYAGAKYTLNRLNVSASVRQETVNNRYVRPQFSVAADYTNKKNTVRTAVSYADKFRYPDLNDLYWTPGGNPRLQPEFGNTIEWQNDFGFNKNKHQLKYSNALYFMRTRNNIIWIAGASGLFSPMNIKKTQHYGMENTLQYTLIIKQNTFLKISCNYNYNQSIILEDVSNTLTNGNIISYKPQHTLKSNIILTNKYIDFGANYLYMGKRYTDDENIEFFAIQPYHILDMFVAAKYTKNACNITLVFRVNNVLNTAYESVRAYAQPLRNYQISIIFNYKSNHHE